MVVGFYYRYLPTRYLLDSISSRHSQTYYGLWYVCITNAIHKKQHINAESGSMSRSWRRCTCSPNIWGMRYLSISFIRPKSNPSCYVALMHVSLLPYIHTYIHPYTTCLHIHNLQGCLHLVPRSTHRNQKRRSNGSLRTSTMAKM